MTLYVGNNDAVTQKVKKAYIGVDGIGRNIKAMYVGDDDGIARKVFPDAQGGGKKGILFSSPNPFTLLIRSLALNPKPRDWVGMEYSFDENTWVPIDIVSIGSGKIYTVFPESVLNPNSGKYEIYVRSDISMNDLERVGETIDHIYFDSIGEELDNISVSGELANLWGANTNSNSTFGAGCAMYIFWYWKGLVDASGLILPEVEEIPESGYNNLFSNCTNLQRAPAQIYGNIVGENGCWNMFNATKIQHPPIFSPKTIKYQGCSRMFTDCTELLDTPDFGQVTNLIGDSNLSYCFLNCKKIKPTFTHLKPTILTATCYEGMFYGVPLVKPVTLPQLEQAEANSCDYMMIDIIIARTDQVTDCVFEIQYSGQVCSQYKPPIPLPSGESFQTNKKYYFDVSLYDRECHTTGILLDQLVGDYATTNGFVEPTLEWEDTFDFATTEWFEQYLAGGPILARDRLKGTATATDGVMELYFDYEVIYDHIENNNTVVFTQSDGSYIKLRNDKRVEMQIYLDF